MKLNITIDFDQVTGLDYESISETISTVVKDEVQKEVTRLVRIEMTKRKHAVGVLVTAAFDNVVNQLKV